MPFTDAIEQALLNHFFNDPSYTPATNRWVGLSSTEPTDAGGNVTEPAGGSYARQPLDATEMGGATGTAPAEKSNTSVVTFPTATADWGGQLTHFVVFDVVSAGTSANVLAFGALATPKTVNSGDTASFGVGDLDFRLGKGTPG